MRGDGTISAEPEDGNDGAKPEEGFWGQIWNAKSDHSIISSAIVFFFLAFHYRGHVLLATAKPVIYLYPEHPTDVTVHLDYNGTLESTYPRYDDGWRVTAHPDGTLLNRDDGREYSYLFWDGKTRTKYDFSSGFVVSGPDTALFLQEKLAYIGLVPREYNEFIVYWLPMMEKNRYNLISFQHEAYTDNATLTITPEPDSVLRVFMAFKPLYAPVEIPPQELAPFERRGFAVA